MASLASLDDATNATTTRDARREIDANAFAVYSTRRSRETRDESDESDARDDDATKTLETPSCSN